MTLVLVLTKFTLLNENGPLPVTVTVAADAAGANIDASSAADATALLNLYFNCILISPPFLTCRD
jgi:hypothetical protein